MFERFTRLARHSLVLAHAESLALGHDWLGTEHQLLGLLQTGDGIAYNVLSDVGLSYPDVRQAVVDAVGGAALDGAALAAIGIDLEEVRRQAEESFGPGALERAMARPHRGRSGPFTPRAKRVLELALGEAVALEHGYIGTEHILLGMLREGGGVGAQILRRLAPDEDLRRYVIERLRAAS
jgi:ATP-dependent Clp protease ATP-binding subunit ClpA